MKANRGVVPFVVASSSQNSTFKESRQAEWELKRMQKPKIALVYSTAVKARYHNNKTSVSLALRLDALFCRYTSYTVSKQQLRLANNKTSAASLALKLDAFCRYTSFLKQTFLIYLRSLSSAASFLKRDIFLFSRGVLGAVDWMFFGWDRLEKNDPNGRKSRYIRVPPYSILHTAGETQGQLLSVFLILFGVSEPTSFLISHGRRSLLFHILALPAFFSASLSCAPIYYA